MSKLQNNFTTTEQSKRLLELGLPADSADCVLVRNLYFPIGEYEIKVLDGKYSRFIEMHDTWEVIPCWSVGRLMEIFDKCKTLRTYCYQDWAEYTTCDDYVKYIISAFNRWISTLNFSKLED